MFVTRSFPPRPSWRAASETDSKRRIALQSRYRNGRGLGTVCCCIPIRFTKKPRLKMKTIEEIPSDKLVIMTDHLHRLFNAGGCNPCCHLCISYIEIGSQFQLATIQKASPPKVISKKSNPENDRYNLIETKAELQESKEVMLCVNCDAEAFNEAERNKTLPVITNKFAGCFRVNGKVVKSI